jgi:hypothetical protein
LGVMQSDADECLFIRNDGSGIGSGVLCSSAWRVCDHDAIVELEEGEEVIVDVLSKREVGDEVEVVEVEVEEGGEREVEEEERDFEEGKQDSQFIRPSSPRISTHGCGAPEAP